MDFIGLGIQARGFAQNVDGLGERVAVVEHTAIIEIQARILPTKFRRSNRIT